MKAYLSQRSSEFIGFQKAVLASTNEALVGFESIRRSNAILALDPEHGIDPKYVRQLMMKRASCEKKLQDTRKMMKQLTDTIPERFGVDFESIVKNITSEAILDALKLLALDIEAKRFSPPSNDSRADLAARIVAEPSFRSRVAQIPFAVHEEKLEIAPSRSRTQRDATQIQGDSARNQVKRVLEKISSGANIIRIDNVDSILKTELIEYIEEFRKNSSDSDSILTLYLIGQAIDRRLAQNSRRPPDERIDEDISFLVQTFLAAHNLFVQSLPIHAKIVEGAERSAILYKRISEVEQGTPWGVLHELSASPQLFGPDAQRVFAKADSALETMRGAETKRNCIYSCRTPARRIAGNDQDCCERSN